MTNHRRIASLLVGLVILVAGCGGAEESAPSAIESSDQDLILQAGTWVSSLGLEQNDPGVWRVRLERACTEGVWRSNVARDLAEEFIEEDLDVSVRAEGLGPPSVGDGAQALWIMAVNVCRDLFPADAIERGAPSP